MRHPCKDYLKAHQKEIDKEQERIDAEKEAEYEKELEEAAEIDGASVSIRNGYERKSWDNKALTGYAAAHPEIGQFCKVSAVKASAVIKVKK